jgi:hypothetical protein
MRNKFSPIIRLVALILTLALITPLNVTAAENEIRPYASNYLTAYNTYICDVGNGRHEIWFEVMGTGDMDEIGTLSIMLYEVNSDGSLKWVKTFLHEDYNNMLSYNDWYHYSYVTYQGSSSKTYKAYVCIWAGKNGNGDTRYMWALE